MKKFLAILLAALLCFACVACAGGSGEDTTAASDDSTAAADDTTAADDTAAKVKVVDIDLSNEEYAYGVDKDQPEILEAINELLKEMHENGQFDEIMNKYFGDGTPEAVTSAKEDSSKDQLVVATNASFEPFEYTKGDQYYGIDMEIAKLLADKLGKELVINNMKFEGVVLSVGQHKCDIAMAGLTVNDERKKQVNFSDSYYEANQKLIVLGDDKTFDECKTKEDVEAILGKLTAEDKIGCQMGTTGQLYVEGSEDMGFAGLAATATTYDNGSLAVQDLINGNVKYVIIDSAPAASITEAINAV